MILVILIFIVAGALGIYGVYHLLVGLKGRRLSRKIRKGENLTESDTRTLQYYKTEELQETKKWVVLLDEAINYGIEGKYWKSIKMARKALEINPRASEAWRLIGNAYEFLGDEMGQKGKYKKAKDLHRKATQAWNEAKKINPNIKIPGYHD